MITPQAFCDVGDVLGEDCDEDGIIGCDSEVQGSVGAIVKLRVEGYLHRPVRPIKTMCTIHQEVFIDNYPFLQKENGCCDPFGVHEIGMLENLTTITDDLYQQIGGRYPYLLPFKQLCAECRETLKEDIYSLVPVVPQVQPQFNLKNMNAVFQYAMKNHTTKIYDHLREMQARSIHVLLMKKNLLCVLPTNAGKSAVIFLPGLIHAKMNGTKPITVVIYPLVNLIQEQFEKMKEYGLNCCKLQAEDEKAAEFHQSYDSMSRGNPFYILTNPEFLEKGSGRQLVINLRDEIKFVLVDEAHQIYDWSKSFRPAFGRIGQLRNVLHASFGLLTGTFTNEMKDTVLKATKLSTSSIEIVAGNPDRKEIFLELRNRSSDWKKDLSFLIEEAENKKLGMQKTVVYFPTTESTYDVNDEFRRLLSYGGIIFPQELDVSYIEQYEGTERLDEKVAWDFISDHLSSLTDKETAVSLTKEFSERNGYLKLLFTTIFYGMGMDNKTIERVVIYDKDENPASIWQKIGRCSRGEGQQGKAIIFVTKKQKEAFNLPCVRKSILHGLVGYEESREVCNCQSSYCACLMCKCCNLCRERCSCREMAVVVENVDLMEVEGENVI